MIFLSQNYGNWKEKKELEKNHDFKKAPISMLNSAEDEDFGVECNSRCENRPPLVRCVRNLDEENEKPVMSFRLPGQLRRLNTSYNPDTKSELDHLDGLTPRNNDSGRVDQIEVTNIVGEVSMDSQSKKVTTQYVEPKTFEEAWNHPDSKQREFLRSAIRKELKRHDLEKNLEKGTPIRCAR